MTTTSSPRTAGPRPRPGADRAGHAGTRPSFVVALPDTDAAASAARRLEAVATTRLTHRSGRPWLLGDVTVGRLVHGTYGPRTVAVVGEHDLDDAATERLAATAHSPLALADHARRRAGSFLVLAAVDGAVHAFGPALQTRRVFTARLGSAWLVADRADVLAALTGAGVDDDALALRLAGSLPHPLDDVVPWRGVQALPGDELVTVDADGARRTTTRWWSAPEPVLTRREGAPLFRGALERAVAARTDDGRGVACDLSGGLDSTPLCHAAARGPRGVLARTLGNDDPGGDEDLRWARLALPTMPGVHTHLVESTDDYEDFYEGVGAVRAVLDEPTQAATAGPRIVRMLGDDAERGLAVHLNGLGGDHLLRGVPAWEHTLARSAPLLAWRRARSEHVPQGVGPVATLRQLLDRRPYGRWLQQVCVAALHGEDTDPGLRVDDWSARPRLAPWLGQDARAHLRATVDRLHDTAPLHPTRAGHADLFYVRDAARLVRGTAQLGHGVGVAYEAPLLDDRVVEAALAVRRDERDTPLEWKPLMKEAMAGVLPDAYLRRTNKVGGGPQSVRGWARHHEALMSLVEESGLLDRGLVDRDALRSTTRPRERETPPTHLHHVVNAALFLRNQQDGPLPTSTTTPTEETA